MTIGLMGGTFNPIHIAHLIIAEWIKDEWDLEKIVFIPTGNPPHKSKNNLLESNIRFDLVEIALSSNIYFEISDFEMIKKEVSYTIDTVSYFSNKYPDEKLYFIIGADTLFKLEKWKDFKELAKMVEFITYSRWGYNKLQIENRIQILKKDFGFQIYYSNGPEIQISSSNIRDRLREGLSIKYMVPDLVIGEIQKRGCIKELQMEILKNKVRDKLGEYRYKHTLNVLEIGLKLARTYNIPKEKVQIAALLHDYEKEISLEKAKELLLEHGVFIEDQSMINIDLIHGELASFIAKADFGIEDKDILNAIKYHTTGRAEMSVLEKIIYLADLIEPSRNIDKLNQIREMAYIDLDKAVLMAMDNTIEYLISRGSLINIDTINARNYIIIEISKRLIDE